MHTVYEYDTDGNVIRLRLENQEGRIFSDFRYEYDLNENRTLKSGSCILPGEDSLKEQSACYWYDSMNRLLEERCDGRPVRYRYDQCGNRLEKVDTYGKEEYNYNGKNQLTSRKTRTETTTYLYDQQGNVLEEAGLHGKTEYSYNALNQQMSVLMDDGRRQENRYDAESLRAGVTENGRAASFLYYNGELLAESGRDETVTSRYILGYGVASGWHKEKEGYHPYHLDEQNSNQDSMGDRAGTATIKAIPDEYSDNALPGKQLNLPEELAYIDPSKQHQDKEKEKNEESQCKSD